MADFVIIAVIALIVGAAARYIYREKKSGAKCIGCPSSKTCGGNCCSCGKET